MPIYNNATELKLNTNLHPRPLNIVFKDIFEKALILKREFAIKALNIDTGLATHTE